MLRFRCLAFAWLIALVAFAPASHGQEPKTLMQRITEWHYPDSAISAASMSDAATVNANGERTVSSIQCKVVMTSSDPIATVVQHYKTQLQNRVAPKSAKGNQEPEANQPAAIDTGRSVTYHEDSENRPVAIHMILINTATTSTTLVISRAEGESETHIAWTQYERF